MHISPVNVSVHTMNPDLRVKMMRNPNAGKSLDYLRRFSDAGIKINAQLVLCPGINDGDELKYSLEALSHLSGVESIAAVPVGLTKYREGLFSLSPFNEKNASEVIEIIDLFNEKLIFEGRSKLVYPSDEFFQIAKRSIPECDYYGDFPQLDNGVGMYALTKQDFLSSLSDNYGDDNCRSIALATGKAAYPLMKLLADAFVKKFSASKIEVYCVENRFFGELVTVSGLITGNDLIDYLQKNNFCFNKLLLPSVMFKSKDELIFLDDVSIKDVENALNTEVIVVDCDGYSLFDAFLKN